MELAEKYDDELLRAFKQEYYSCEGGKYNLAVQVKHLARLAEYYETRYLKTDVWTDCLRAHSLYNSCGARDPSSEIWPKKAFKVQQDYWKGTERISYQEQVALTHRLVSHLETIRYESKSRLLDSHLTEPFDIGSNHSEDVPKAEFCSSVQAASQTCTEMMICLARTIMEASVKAQKVGPPCGFTAVAIGSLARGEATPYSDLEYLFLLEKKTDAIEEYFERLAVTSYFIIGNLGETKLSYMAIDELSQAKWFDDVSKNGFKIDGLAAGAGNIPTGNGCKGTRNHFIVTPQELLGRYSQVYTHPTRAEALRGDLTAMMTYMEALYVYGQDDGEQLLSGLRKNISSVKPSKARCDMNNEMLQRDLSNFNFRPDLNLRNEGFTLNVKKQLYRFPSIILFDFSIILCVHGSSTWETLNRLLAKKLISQDFYENMRFQLACACFIRMSAYLYHNSHDDRMSVSTRISPFEDKPRKGADNSGSCRRWYVPQGLFHTLCQYMVPLKHHMSSMSQNILQALMWSRGEINQHINSILKMYTFFCCGRYKESLAVLKGCFDGKVWRNPVQFYHMFSSEGYLGIKMDQYIEAIIALLVECSDFETALKYAEFLEEHTKSDDKTKLMIAVCHRELSQFYKACDLLSSISDVTGDVLLEKGLVEIQLSVFDKAEEHLVSAFKSFCKETSKETDYGHDKDVPDDDDESISRFQKHSRSDLLQHLPDNASTGMLTCLMSLSVLYNKLNYFETSEQYWSKVQSLMSNLFGADTLVPIAAKLSRHIAGHSRDLQNYTDIKHQEGLLKSSLNMFEKLYGDESPHIDISIGWNNLGIFYLDNGHFQKALESFELSLSMLNDLFHDGNHVRIVIAERNLAMVHSHLAHDTVARDIYQRALSKCSHLYTDPNGGNPGNVQTAGLLCNMGTVNHKLGNINLALENTREALQIYKSIYGSRADHVDIALVLRNLAGFSSELGLYDKAEQFYQQSLIMFECIYKIHGDNIYIANTLNRIGSWSIKPGVIACEDNQHLMKSLSMFRDIFGHDSNRLDIAAVLCSIGSHYNSVKLYDDAISYFRLSLEKYCSLDDGSDILSFLQSILLNNLARVYSVVGEYALACDCFQKAVTKILPAGVRKALFADLQGIDYSDLISLYSGMNYPYTLTVDIAELFQEMANHYRRNQQYDKMGMCHRYALALLEVIYKNAGGLQKRIAKIFKMIGDNHCDASRYQEAEKHYMTAMGLFSNLEDIPINQVERAKIHGKLSVVYTAIGRWEESHKQFQKGEQIFEEAISSSGQWRVDFGIYLKALGVSFSILGLHSRAESSLQNSLELYNKQFGDGNDNMLKAEVLHCIADNYTRKKLFDAAEAYYKQTVDMYVQLGPVGKVGTWDRLISHAKSAMAYIFLNRKQYAESLKCCDEVLNFHVARHGSIPRHADVANALCKKGACYVMLKQCEEGQKYYNESIEMYKNIYQQESNPLVASVYVDMGHSYHDIGMYDEAEKCYLRGLSIYRSVHGDNACHPDIGEVLCELASHYTRCKRFDVAERHCLEAKSVMDQIYGNGCNRDMERVHSLFGNVYLMTDRYVDAMKHYTQSLNQLRTIYGLYANHPKIAHALTMLAICCKQPGQLSQSTDYNRQVVDMYRELSCGNSDCQNVANALKSLAFNYADGGLYEKALECFTEALGMYKSYDSKSDISSTLTVIGNTYAAMLKYPEAVKHYAEACDYLEPTALFDMAKLLELQGNSLHQSKQYKKAADSYSRALNKYREVFGEESMQLDIAKVLYHSSSNYLKLEDEVRAKECATQALGILQSDLVSNDDLHVCTLTTLATVHILTRCFEEARVCIMDTIKVHEQADGVGSNNAKVATQQWILGSVYNSLKECQSAGALSDLNGYA